MPMCSTPSVNPLDGNVNRGGTGGVGPAAKFDPANVRYAYVLGVALHSRQQQERGIEVLRSAHRRHPADVAVLGALASFESERGNRQAALEYVEKMQQLSPNDPGIVELLQSIQSR